jgi:calcium-dependent protein kinase
MLESFVVGLIRQLLLALEHLVICGVEHRDVKPENLLLDKDSENPRVTIIDFGTSGVLNPEKKMSQKFGTPYYIAPEVLKKSYNQMCDLWSCGVILYILLCGYPPFNGADDKKIIQAVMKGEFTVDEPEWADVSEEAKDLVQRLL